MTGGGGAAITIGIYYDKVTGNYGDFYWIAGTGGLDASVAGFVGYLDGGPELLDGFYSSHTISLSGRDFIAFMDGNSNNIGYGMGGGLGAPYAYHWEAGIGGHSAHQNIYESIDSHTTIPSGRY
ncbi:MAG TPA: hypothetical protein EYG82_08320 [Sulfurovum sp.]|nr:hypothetical protein [Sulfurovum sp.]